MFRHYAPHNNISNVSPCRFADKNGTAVLEELLQNRFLGKFSFTSVEQYNEYFIITYNFIAASFAM